VLTFSTAIQPSQHLLKTSRVVQPKVTIKAADAPPEFDAAAEAALAAGGEVILTAPCMFYTENC
jgi:hypothetical protein